MKTNMIHSPSPNPLAALLQTGLFAAALALLSLFPALRAPAQTTNLINSSTTIDNPTTAGWTLPAGSTTSYLVADSATLTFTKSGVNPAGTNGGLYNLANTAGSGNMSLSMGPMNTNGLVIFSGITTANQGGVFYITATSGAPLALNLNNVIFDGNHTTANGAGGAGGAIFLGSFYASANLANALFLNNYSSGVGGGGAIGTIGALTVTGGAFSGNYALIGPGGAVTVPSTNGNNTLIRSDFTNVLFINNRAATNGGVFASRPASSTAGPFTATNSVFTDNWAGAQGGVGYSTYNGPSTAMGYAFYYTADGGTDSYLISGNGAGYSTSGTATQTEVQNNAPLGAAQAKAGGFMFTGSGGRTTLFVDDAITLTIGDAAATNKALDTIASADNRIALMEKNGAGDLILNANNAYYSGTFNINAGRALLGNSAAQLGGFINVASGATFGGSGTIRTLSQSDAALATTVTMQPGSTLQIGLDNATSGQQLAFARTGANTLTLDGDVALTFNLHGSDGADPAAYDRLIADQFTATGLNTITVTGLGAGAYDLISAASFNGDASNFTVTVLGGASARHAPSLFMSGNDLMLGPSTGFSNLSLYWTGSTSATWTANTAAPSAANWTDNGSVPETNFYTGDHVTFDGLADASSPPANRAIAIDSAGVTVSGITVSNAAGADYTFTGGAITVDAASAQPNFTGTTGILEKTGAGALTLSNAENNFGAIALLGGALRLGNATSQLAAPITIANGATLGGIGGYTGSVLAQAGATIAPGLPDETTGQPLTINTLTLEGATLHFNLYDDATNDKLIVGALAPLTGTNTIDLNATKNGTFTIATINAGDLATLALSQVTIAGMPQGGARQTIGLTTSGNDLLLTSVVDISRAMTWSGTDAATPTLWDTNASNWRGSNNTVSFATGDRVTFDDTSATSTHTIAINATRATVSDMLVAGPADYTFTGGAIYTDTNSLITETANPDNLSNATGKLLKTGPGALTLANTTASAPNNFAGGIELDGGSINFATPGASGATAITIDAPAAGARVTIGAALDGLLLPNPIALTAAATTLTIDTLGNSSTFTGPITGAGALAITGNGAVALAGANTFTGAVTLAGGTLALASASALGASQTLAITTAPSTLQWQTDALNLAQTIAATADLTADTQNHTATISGNLTTASAFTKTGAGALTLAGPNTALTGALTIAQGELDVTSFAAIGGGASTGANTNPIAIATGATLAIGSPAAPAPAPAGGASAASGDISLARALTGGGLLSVALDTPATTLSFANATAGAAFTGTLAMNRGTFLLDENAAAALSSPTSNLTIAPDAIAQKTGPAFTINTLTLDGGRLNLSLTAGSPAAQLLTVNTLDTGATLTQIGVDPAQLGSAGGGSSTGPINLFDQGASTGVQLLAARTVTGAGSVQLTALDGSALSADGVSSTFTQNGPTPDTTGAIGTALFSYAATIQADGIYAGYGLASLDINAGKTLILDNTAASSANSALDAVLTGAGGVQVTAAGLITLTAQNTYTGTTALLTGTLAATTANAFAQSSAFTIATGAAFALNNTDQTLQNLTGAGAILAGTSTLTLQNTADTTYAGAINGGALVKQGPAQLTLTASSSQLSTALAAGTLAIANAGALGAPASPLAITGSNATLVAATDALVLANPINMARNGLVITTPAGAATLAGVISGPSQLTLAGAGVTTLSAANTFTGGLVIAAPRAIALGNAAAIGIGPVTLGAAATLEFRDIPSGAVNNSITTAATAPTDGTVEVNNSTLTFGGANALAHFRLLNNSAVTTTAGATLALGGATSAVEVLNGGKLTITTPGTLAQSLLVAGNAKLAFTATLGAQPQLILADAATFAASSTIAIASALSGERVLIAAPAINGLDNVTFDTGADNTGYITTRNGQLLATTINMAANPGKDIAAAYDSIAASTQAVYAHVSESFLLPPAENRVGYWAKTLGNFANYTGDATKIGYRANTYGMLVGYDAQLTDTSLCGLYAGYNTTSITTTNNATNQAKLPYAGAYAGLRHGTVYAAADAHIGAITADTHRVEADATGITGTYKANIYAASLEAGFIMNSWDAGVIRPSLSMRYMRVAFNSQNESVDPVAGAATPGIGAIYLDDFKDSRLEYFLNMQVSQKFQTPWKREGWFDFSVGYRLDMSNTRSQLTGRFSQLSTNPFTIDCDNYDSDGLVAGLGLRAMLGKTTLLGITYDYESGRQFARHNIAATLRWNW